MRLKNNILSPDKNIRYDAAGSALKFQVGDEIKLNEADLARLSSAFFNEMKIKHVSHDSASRVRPPLCNRYRKPEPAALAWLAFDADLPSHRLDQRFGDGQTQPASSARSRTRFIAPVKPVK